MWMAVVAALAAQPSSSIEPPAAQPFALTISGGISRGSYEAGVNWALVTAMRGSLVSDAPDVDLRVVTGASAGTINTFLTALTWCRALPDRPGDGEAANQSLFWQAWVPVSYGGLFPPDDGDGVDDPACVHDEHEDGLFRRAGFCTAERNLRAALSDTSWRDGGCDVVVGTTITPAHTERLTPPNAPTLEVPSMRFVVALRLHAERGAAPTFHPLTQDQVSELTAQDVRGRRANWIAQLGPVWELPVDATGAVDVRDVFDVNFASSAFPAAFGHKCVRGHLRAPGPGQPAPPHSNCDGSTTDRYFLDGGVFDNVPLPLARQLADVADARRATLLYVDPELRRPLRRSDDSAPRMQGLGAVAQLVADAVPVARAYELQVYLRQRPPSAPAEIFSHRYPPIVGETMFSFGGFFLEEFRAFDFYAGVYDGLVEMATFLTEPEGGARPTLGQLTPALLLILPAVNMERDPDLRGVFEMLLRSEFAGDAALDDIVAALPRASRPINALIGAVARANLPRACAADADCRVDVGERCELASGGVRGARGSCVDGDVNDCGALQGAVDEDCRLAHVAALVATDPAVVDAVAHGGLPFLQDAWQQESWRRNERAAAERFLAPHGWQRWFDGESQRVIDRAIELENDDADALRHSDDPRVHDFASGAATRRRALVAADVYLEAEQRWRADGWLTPAASFAPFAPQRAMLDVYQKSLDVIWRPWFGKPDARFGLGVDVGLHLDDSVLQFGQPSGGLTPPVLDVIDAMVPRLKARGVDLSAALAGQMHVWSDLGVALEVRLGGSWTALSDLDRRLTNADAAPLQLGADVSLDVVFLYYLRASVGLRHITLDRADLSLSLGVDDPVGLASAVGRAL